MNMLTLIHLGALATTATAARGLLGAVVTTAHATAANPFMWYATRAAAVCAYILLTLTVVMGLARSLARVARVRVSWLVEENHQTLAAIAAVFVALHLLTLLLDPLIPFTPLNLLIPVNEPYSPIAVALGVLALYGMVALLASSWLRRRLSYRAWRTLHYVSFITFVLVTAHGVFAGSDTRQPWMYLIYLASAVIVGLGTLARMFWPSQPTRPQPRPAYQQAPRRRRR